MSARSLEQRVDIKFCVECGKDASDSCAMLSEAYKRGTMDKSNVFQWHKRFRESAHVEITSEDNAHHFLRYQVYCSPLIHSKKPHSQPRLLCALY
jgi:hypothetical protein